MVAIQKMDTVVYYYRHICSVAEVLVYNNAVQRQGRHHYVVLILVPVQPMVHNISYRET